MGGQPFARWMGWTRRHDSQWFLWVRTGVTRAVRLSFPPRCRLQEIDTYIVQAKERSYETVLSFGKRGLNIAASAAVQAAAKVPWASAFQQPTPPPGPFGRVQLSVGEPRDSSCPSQGSWGER